MEDVKGRVVKILSTVLKVDEEECSHHDIFSEIGDWDSLTHLYVFLEIEKEFGIRFDIQETANMSSISNVTKLIQTKIY